MCISLIWSFEDTESVVKAALWMKSSRLVMVFLPFSADVKCHQGSQFRVKWPDRRCVQNSNIWRFRRHLALGHDRIGLGGELYLLPTFLAPQLSKWYQQVCHFHHFNLVEFVFQPPLPPPLISRSNLQELLSWICNHNHSTSQIWKRKTNIWFLEIESFTRNLTFPSNFGGT